jgi:hypothetical protein
MQTKKADTSSTVRFAIAASVLFLSLLAGCRGSGQTNQNLEGTPLNTSTWETVYAGRASLRTPKARPWGFEHTEVNQVELRRIPSGASSFEQMWQERVNAIRPGTGEPNAHTTVTREYPGQHTILFDSTGQQRTIEHWQVYGSVILAGQTVMTLADLNLGEQAIQELFAAITPYTVPQRGDFALDDANVHIPLNGREAVSLSWTVLVPGKSPGTTVPLHFTLLRDVVAEVGKPDVLASIPKLKQVSEARGVRVTVLYAGNRKLAGLNGEASALTLLDTKHPQTYSFSARWGSPGRANDAMAPGIDFSAAADSVQNVDPNVLLSYWQAVSDSLRFQ